MIPTSLGFTSVLRKPEYIDDPFENRSLSDSVRVVGAGVVGAVLVP